MAFAGDAASARIQQARAAREEPRLLVAGDGPALRDAVRDAEPRGQLLELARVLDVLRQVGVVAPREHEADARRQQRERLDGQAQVLLPLEAVDREEQRRVPRRLRHLGVKAQGRGEHLGRHGEPGERPAEDARREPRVHEHLCGNQNFTARSC